MFTKQHYKEIAKILNKWYLYPGRIKITALVVDFVKFFKKDNPKFDKDKFKEECYKVNQDIT